MNQTAQSGETRGPEIRSADIAPSSMKRTKAARHHLVIDAAGSEGCFGQTPEHSSSKTQGLTNLFDFFQLTLLGLFVARWRSFATVWKQTWNSAHHIPYSILSFSSMSLEKQQAWTYLCNPMHSLCTGWKAHLHLELVWTQMTFSCPSSLHAKQLAWCLVWNLFVHSFYPVFQLWFDMFKRFDPLICYGRLFSHSGLPKVVVIALEAIDAFLRGGLHDIFQGTTAGVESSPTATKIVLHSA